MGLVLGLLVQLTSGQLAQGTVIVIIRAPLCCLLEWNVIGQGPCKTQSAKPHHLFSIILSGCPFWLRPTVEGGVWFTHKSLQVPR